MNLTSPFNNKNYDFICENTVDLTDDFIEYSENNLNRTKNIFDIYTSINNIDNAIKIELSIFEYSLLYCVNHDFNKEYVVPIYNEKMNNLLIALKNNTEFTNITIKKINPKYIGFLPFEKLFPEKWNIVIAKLEEKEQHENNIVYSDAYKCFKCGESKCKISMKQIRSMDEPMTTFVKCLVCGNAFKIN